MNVRSLEKEPAEQACVIDVEDVIRMILIAPRADILHAFSKELLVTPAGLAVKRFDDESIVTKFLPHISPNPNCSILLLSSALVVSVSYKLFHTDRPNDMIVAHVIASLYCLDVSTKANTCLPTWVGPT